MDTTVTLYSTKVGEIEKFLNRFLENSNYEISDKLKWVKKYENSVELADIIGIFVDNIDSYSINMWVSVDKNVLINVTVNNANDIIKYLYERFPY